MTYEDIKGCVLCGKKGWLRPINVSEDTFEPYIMWKVECKNKQCKAETEVYETGVGAVNAWNIIKESTVWSL